MKKLHCPQKGFSLFSSRFVCFNAPSVESSESVEGPKAEVGKMNTSALQEAIYNAVKTDPGLKNLEGFKKIEALKHGPEWDEKGGRPKAQAKLDAARRDFIANNKMLAKAPEKAASKPDISPKADQCFDRCAALADEFDKYKEKMAPVEAIADATQAVREASDAAIDYSKSTLAATKKYFSGLYNDTADLAVGASLRVKKGIVKAGKATGEAVSTAGRAVAETGKSAVRATSEVVSTAVDFHRKKIEAANRALERGYEATAEFADDTADLAVGVSIAMGQGVVEAGEATGEALSTAGEFYVEGGRKVAQATGEVVSTAVDFHKKKAQEAKASLERGYDATASFANETADLAVGASLRAKKGIVKAGEATGEAVSTAGRYVADKGNATVEAVADQGRQVRRKVAQAGDNVKETVRILKDEGRKARGRKPKEVTDK